MKKPGPPKTAGSVQELLSSLHRAFNTRQTLFRCFLRSWYVKMKHSNREREHFLRRAASTLWVRILLIMLVFSISRQSEFIIVLVPDRKQLMLLVPSESFQVFVMIMTLSPSAATSDASGTSAPWAASRLGSGSCLKLVEFSILNQNTLPTTDWFWFFLRAKLSQLFFVVRVKLQM